MLKPPTDILLRVFCSWLHQESQQASQENFLLAQSSQIRAIRKKMVDIMTKEIATEDLKSFVTKLIPDSIGKDIEKECTDIYPLKDVHIRKVKVLKKPKFDVSKLMELHGEIGGAVDESGEGISGAAGEFVEPEIQEAV